MRTLKTLIAILLAGCFYATPSWAATTTLGEDVGLAVGQTISLDLKGVDIVDVLKLLSQKGGLNFVAGRNVNGRVTIFAKDVDIWNAFERIVNANDLAYEIHDNLINVMTARDYEVTYGTKFREPTQREVISLQHAQAIQVATVLNQLKSAVGRVIADETSNTLVLIDVDQRIEPMRDIVEKLDRPTETLIRKLNYANGEELQEKITNLLTPIGTFNFDARTSRIIVDDLPDVITKVEQMVRTFDTQDPQVQIDSRILSVTLSDEYSLGIDWSQVFSGVDVQTRANFNLLGDVIGGTDTGGVLQYISAPQNNTSVVIEALKTIGDTQTLSNPKIVVSNNQEAKILVGTKEATVSVSTTVPSTGTVVTSPEIQYVDVGTKLYVTPSIKDDGHVMLTVRPEVSTARIETFADNRIPIVTTTEAETTVLVRSGVTLIIGGLIETSDSQTVNKIPMLGDIPFVGKAFQSESDTKSRSELVVFLTPQIITPEGSEVLPEVLVDRSFEAVDQNIPLPLDYRAYIRKLLQDAVYKDLQANDMNEGTAVLNFIMNRSGEIQQVISVQSPQGLDFASVVEQSLRRVEFPAFPESVGLEEVRFKMAVEFTPTPLNAQAESL